MTENYKHWTRQRGSVLWSFGWTTLFCIAIAILLWVLALSEPFIASLGISLCIGWSILGVHILLGPRLEPHLGLTFTNAVATTLGIAIALGLISVYSITAGLHLNGLDWNTAAPALFFGVIGTIIFSNMARVHQMREDLSQAELGRLATERALAEAQLKTLQAQIEPHFLFNTLTTAISLIETQPRAAEETLLQLTKLLRNSLSRTRTTHSTLAEELSLINAYLRIAKIRMGPRLNFSVTSDDQLDDFNLPPMLVQPLVENALTHGLEPSETGGEVCVEVRQTADGIIITVTDNGLGLSVGGNTAGSNTGLRNVRERLKQLYGHKGSLRLTQNEPSGVIATLQIPRQSNATSTTDRVN